MWCKERLLIMMFPGHQVLMMIEFTHVVGSLNWKNGMSIFTECADDHTALQTTVTQV